MGAYTVDNYGYEEGEDYLYYEGKHTGEQKRRDEAYSELYLNENQADINFRYGEKAAEEAYKRQLEMWQMQNEYNSPASQVERLKAAGLNPGLMYGQGAGAGGTGNASTMTAPKGSGPVGVSGGRLSTTAESSNAEMAKIQTGVQIANSLSQGAQGLANSIKTMTEAKKTAGVDTEKIKADTVVANKQVEKMTSEIMNIGQDSKLKSAQVENTQAATENINIRNEINKATTKEQIEQIKLQTEQETTKADSMLEELGEKIRNNKIGERTYNSQVKQIVENVRETQTDIALKEAQIKLTEKGIELNANQITKIKAEAKQIWTNMDLGWENIAQKEKDRHVNIDQFEQSIIQRYTQQVTETATAFGTKGMTTRGEYTHY